MEKSLPVGPSTRQVVLGLFIVGQLFFLLAANLLQLTAASRRVMDAHPALASVVSKWTDPEGHLHDAGELFSAVTTRWSEVTGQPQNWSLFAPNVTEKIPFVAVELCWEEDPHSAASLARHLLPLTAAHSLEEVSVVAAPVLGKDSGDWKKLSTLLAPLTAPLQQEALPPAVWRNDPHFSILLHSENEPKDIRHFLRVGKFRLRRFEASIDLPLTSDGKPPDEVVDGWRESIEGKLREDGKAIEAYLRWRLRRFQEKHPDLPTPKQVILWVRVYRVPSPDGRSEPWSWLGPEQTPLARWQPGARWQANYYPVEMFNPVVPRFESVRVKE
jgi:hypothetical protein